jgi:hypothetical protein
LFSARPAGVLAGTTTGLAAARRPAVAALSRAAVWLAALISAIARSTAVSVGAGSERSVVASTRLETSNSTPITANGTRPRRSDAISTPLTGTTS